jgi:Protein of unknown function DUF262
MEMRSERRALDKIYKRRDRYEIPDWQRKKVWSLEKKRRLIDTILRGWKLPKFYFQKTQENREEFDVVDGQQRLTAIWEFMDGELQLNSDQAAKYGGADYAGLPETLSDTFDDYEIEYDEITNATDPEIKEFFQRLQAGLPLTSSEKLNSVHSKLRDYCVKAARHPFFSRTTVISDKRYGHFDIVAKVATIEIEGLDAGLRFDDVEKVFKSNSMFSVQSAAAKRIDSALKYLHDGFPRPFPLFRNRTIVQSVITLVCHLQQAGLPPKRAPVLREFVEFFLAELRKQVELGQNATDQDFLAFQRTVNANVKTGARTRHSILLRQLFRKHPDFFSSFSQSAEITKGMGQARDELARNVRELISSINERYAARHGSDLFKPTNKTATALTSLGMPLVSLHDYRVFIDNLYFVFREGIGQRLNANVPRSFLHINDLRTMLQHDVDHGQTSKVAKKRKQLAAVFQGYAGVSSPDAIDPSLFPLVQTNILGALVSDLGNLAKSLL